MKMIKLSFCLFSVLLLFSSCENSTSRLSAGDCDLYAITFHVGDNTSGAPPRGMLFIVIEEDDEVRLLSITTCNLRKDGYYLYAWNTEADGSGHFIPKEGIPSEQVAWYGTRLNDGSYRELLDLYPVWIKNGSTFLINPIGDGTAKIELSIANEETITVPGTIDGYTITSIGENFSWFQGSEVRAIIFPDSVTDIASGALSSDALVSWDTQYSNVNTQLTSVSLPNSLKTLNANLFSGCTNLTSIILPASLTIIGEGCFSGCTNLTSIVFPETLLTIEYRAFRDCTSLQVAEFVNANCEIDSNSNYTPFRNTSPLFKIRAPSGGTVNAFCTENGILFEPVI